MATEPVLQQPSANHLGERGMDSVFIHSFAEPTQLDLNASAMSPRSGLPVGKDTLAGLEAERSWSPPASRSAIRVAVKDLIDMVGTITTAGCKAVAATAIPALIDAPLLTEMRRLESLGEVRFVGKTNLHELAFGADGINPAYGTPTNPLDPGNVPGGSSSGSAVAVATGLADIALGSDTGGSIRIPAACCGIVGLKTTWGRIPADGVWPLAPFLDTVGPMARTVTETAHGLALLDPSFSVTEAQKLRIRTIGRIRLADTPVDPVIDAAVDAALLATGVAVLDITLPYWQEVHRAGITVILAEAWRGNRFLLEDPNLAVLVHPMTNARLRLGEFISDAELADAQLIRAQTAGELARLFERFDVLALPTLTMLPPKLEDAQTAPLTALTRFANLTGLPALSLPIPLMKNHANPSETAKAPTSLQLIGPMHREDLVLAAGLLLERSITRTPR
jgi:amidase